MLGGLNSKVGCMLKADIMGDFWVNSVNNNGEKVLDMNQHLVTRLGVRGLTTYFIFSRYPVTTIFSSI